MRKILFVICVFYLSTLFSNCMKEPDPPQELSLYFNEWSNNQFTVQKAG